MNKWTEKSSDMFSVLKQHLVKSNVIWDPLALLKSKKILTAALHVKAAEIMKVEKLN